MASIEWSWVLDWVRGYWIRTLFCLTGSFRSWFIGTSLMIFLGGYFCCWIEGSLCSDSWSQFRVPGESSSRLSSSEVGYGSSKVGSARRIKDCSSLKPLKDTGGFLSAYVPGASMFIKKSILTLIYNLTALEFDLPTPLTHELQLWVVYRHHAFLTLRFLACFQWC